MIQPTAHLPLLPLQQSRLYQAALTRIGADACLQPFAGRRAVVLWRAVPGLGRVALLSRPALDPARDLTDARRDLGAQVLIVNADTSRDSGRDAGHDADHLHRAGFVRLAPPRAIAVLSLAGSCEDWLARMDGKWRNRLRHAHRRGLSVTHKPLPPDPRHWLFFKDADQQAARGYRALPPALSAAMAGHDPQALRLVSARQDGQTIAAMLFACHGGTASYLVGWTSDAGRAQSAHNLILWQAMGDLAALGIGWIDLGLCDARTTPGLARFKLESGARLRLLGGTWGAAAITAPLHAILRSLRATPPPPATGAPGPVAPR